MPTIATSSAHSSTTNSHIFYETLGYPVPANAEFFERKFSDETTEKSLEKKSQKKVSPQKNSDTNASHTAKTLAEFAREIQAQLDTQKSTNFFQKLFSKTFLKKIPKIYETFFHSKKFSPKISEKKSPPTTPDPQKFSGPRRHELNPHTATALRKICELSRLRPNIPFVDAIFLCDSHSFNAGKPDSDIDLFLITRPGALRRARFFSVLIFRLLGLKRSFTKKSGKFDLIFYRSADTLNLRDFAISDDDIYFHHRIAHLQPIRSTTTENQNITQKILQENLWVSKKISQPTPATAPTSIIKSTKTQTTKALTEKAFSRKIREKIIKNPRQKIITRKTKKRKTNPTHIKTSEITLAFHHDIRPQIREKIRQKTKSFHKPHASDCEEFSEKYREADLGNIDA